MDISTVKKRAGLPARSTPHWMRLRKGCFLGFRKSPKTLAETWSARFYDKATGRQEYKALSDFAELPANLRFDAASAEANIWFSHLGRGGTVDTITVNTVCEHYVEYQLERLGAKAAKDAYDRFHRYVLDDPRFAAIELQKLTPLHIDDWRKRLAQRRTPQGSLRTKSTLNRDMTCLRAALNLALAKGYITSSFAWENALRPFQNVDDEPPRVSRRLVGLS